MSKLRILNGSGDTTLGEWKTDDPVSIEKVRAQFDEIIKEGYQAFRIDSPESGEMIREFDPQAKEILLTAPMVGG